MSNIIQIRFPEDQQEGTEASISNWLIKAGDRVAAHEPVVEIETDKVVVEIAAPEAGRIAEISIDIDGQVNPGDVLCTLSIAADDDTVMQADTVSPADTDDTPTAVDQVQVDTNAVTDVEPFALNRLSPAVRQRVMQHGLNLSGINGSGRGGRITLRDVEKLMAGEPQAQMALSPAVEGSQIIPHDKMRRRIADSMVSSLMHTAPHVTAVFEADLSAVMQHRKANKDSYAQAGSPLTLSVYFVAAAIAALQKVPQVNSRWFDDHLEIFQHINFGIGTALGDKGLIVPVIKHAQNLDLKGIATQLADLTLRARNNKLRPEDVRGGTFTLSNHGVSGSLIATPIIINQPQSAILGVGKIEKRVKIKEVDGQDVIAIRPMCYVSLTIDHRVLDGHQTNAFLTELVDRLENWS